MVKKKIDNRIRLMIENGVKLKHRTMFVIVGDKGRDQVCLQNNMRYIELLKCHFRCQFCMICWSNHQLKPDQLFCGVTRTRMKLSQSNYFHYLN